jgi:hypothetical protein
MTAAPVPPAATPVPPASGHGTARREGYAGQAARGLACLGRLFGREPGFAGVAQDAVDLLFGTWGHRTARGIDEPEAARGRAPFEFSLVMKDRGPEIRIFLRPLSDEGPTTATASWENGWRTLRALEECGAASLTRARTVRDLFVPRSEQAAFGMCVAATVRPTGVADPGAERPDDAALYVPFQRYTPSGSETLARLRPYVRPADLTRLARFLAHGAAEEGQPQTGEHGPNPFHWAAAKLKREARDPLTLYVSAATVDRASGAEG